MQSLALISDIHGNLVALNAALDRISADGITDIVCLGDTVDLGPQPEACTRRLMEFGVPCVRGNHDTLNEAVANPLLAVEDWTRANLTPQVQAFLEGASGSLERNLGAHRVFCAHGSPRSDTEGVLGGTSDSELEAMMASAADFDAIVVGHTHVQLVRRLGRRIVVNVGSVGMPFKRPFGGGGPPEIFKWAEYAVLRSSQGHLSVELCRVDYAFSEFVDSFDPSFPGVDQWLATWID